MSQEKISLKARRELLGSIQKKYNQASGKEKKKILNSFIASTGYQRKYAIHLLNRININNETTQRPIVTLKKKGNKNLPIIYTEEVFQALLTLWHASNQICSKRLVPFLPELIAVLERNGHLSLSLDVKQKLLKISPATVDRLLKEERSINNHGVSTTRSGSLIKKKIEVRTFADWNNASPGFVEADLVAHCGDRAEGSFLYTLVLTDIASSWTEFIPLLRKSGQAVISALKIARKQFPFPLLGLDTDNGSEFINNKLLKYCQKQKITFTRSRPYHSNDQAHVEEKNGSIIRKTVGYDRFEGYEAYKALESFYVVLNLYVNFFQPSMKLISKQRHGAKVKKMYDKAKTPYQRLLLSSDISKDIKASLKQQYESLDPVGLLKMLKELQNQLFQHSWKKPTIKTIPLIGTDGKGLEPGTGSSTVKETVTINQEVTIITQETGVITPLAQIDSEPGLLKRYTQTKKPKKTLKRIFLHWDNKDVYPFY